MPDAPRGNAADGGAADTGPAPDPDESGPTPAAGGPPPDPGGPPPGAGRAPGWREVLALAGLVLAAVFAVEILSSALPPVREAFRGLPVTILALVIGTVGVLLLVARRRPRG